MTLKNGSTRIYYQCSVEGCLAKKQVTINAEKKEHIQFSATHNHEPTKRGPVKSSTKKDMELTERLKNGHSVQDIVLFLFW